MSEWTGGRHNPGAAAASGRAIEWGSFDASISTNALPDWGRRRPWWYRLVHNWRMRMLIETHHWE